MASGSTAPFAKERAGIAHFLRSDRARSLVPIVVFLVALVVRLRFVDEHPPGLYVVSDMEFYDRRADRLIAGDRTIWDTFTPVGYPALLALVYAIIGKSYAAIGVLQAICGAGTCVVSYAITRRITRSHAAGAIVGLALALYSPLVMYTGFLLTETAFSFLVATTAWALLRAMDGKGLTWPLAAGLALGAATAMRPNLILAYPLLAACSLLRRRVAHARRAPLFAVLFSIPILLGVATHNSRLAQRPVALATNGGLNFFLGLCECRAVRFPGQKISEVSAAHNRKRFTEIVSSTEPAHAEGHHYRAALSLIVHDPARMIRSFVKVADGFGLTGDGPPPAQPYWPGWNGHDAELRWFSRAAVVLVFVPALLGTLWLLRRRELLWDEHAPRLILLALLGSVPLSLYLFLGDARLRVSFDPLAFAIAADAWLRFARSLKPGLLRHADP